MNYSHAHRPILNNIHWILQTNTNEWSLDMFQYINKWHGTLKSSVSISNRIVLLCRAVTWPSNEMNLLSLSYAMCLTYLLMSILPWSKPFHVCVQFVYVLHSRCIAYRINLQWFIVVNIGYIFGAGGSFNKRRWTNYSWLQTNGLWNCKTNGNLSTCIHRLSIQICIICIYARNKNHLT